MSTQTIAVIGAGAWGTAIALLLGRQGTHRVSLWAYEKEVRDSILDRRTNELFLPGEVLPPTIVPTNDLAEALSGAEIVASVSNMDVPLSRK